MGDACISAVKALLEIVFHTSFSTLFDWIQSPTIAKIEGHCDSMIGLVEHIVSQQ